MRTEIVYSAASGDVVGVGRAGPGWVAIEVREYSGESVKFRINDVQAGELHRQLGDLATHDDGRHGEG